MAGSTSFSDFLDTKEKKLAFFQNLIMLALADRNLDEQESSFLLMIGNQLGLTEEDTRQITDNISTLSFTIPEKGLQKTLELQTLVMMMLQDNRLAKREYNLCLEYANRIGYSKDVLDEMIEKLKND